MDKRSELPKSEQHNRHSAGHYKKGKKRSDKRNNAIGNWCDGRQGDQSGGQVPNMDYTNAFWQQQGMQQQLPAHSGQRLFTAMSDPSVCGFSAMPMSPVTYAMEPVSLSPMYRLYQPMPRPNYRAFRDKPRRNVAQNRRSGSQINANVLTNGYSSLQENNLNYSMPVAYQNGDYASLPPTANNDNGIGEEELNSEHRRYSDPGLGPAELPTHSRSEDSDSTGSGSSTTTVDRNSKLVLALIEQVTALKESNGQLFKEVQEYKSELETIKVELAQLKHGTSADYQPGMLSDIVREMREANKVREEALITKVKSMLEDKSAPRSTELDELKNRLTKITEEKEESDRHLEKLEEEIAGLKLNANNEGREIAAFEEENLALRRELQEARASRTLAENHVAKLEKLVGILRKKMNGATDKETVTDIRELVASGLSLTSGLAIAAKIEEENRSSLDGNDAMSSSNAKSTSSSASNSDAPSLDNSVSNSNNSLSGPVTDL